MATITTYAQLNIGRNIGAEPMSQHQWDQFVVDAKNTLLFAAVRESWTLSLNAQVQIHRGTGSWNGVDEDSAHVSLYWEDGIDVNELNTYARLIARKHGQDAIAVVTGSTLIQAEAPAPLPAPVSALRHVANRPALIPA